MFCNKYFYRPAAGAVEYADYISKERQGSHPDECPAFDTVLT